MLSLALLIADFLADQKNAGRSPHTLRAYASDLAQLAAFHIRERIVRKEYDSIENGETLAETLTRDLRAVSKDRHISVHYSPTVLPPEPPEPPEPLAPTPAEVQGMRDVLAKDNFGFERVEVLKGNLGYIKINLFAPPELAADTYTAAMNYVAHTDALIIDLRENGGSISPDAVPMLCSYFFEQPVHLNDIYWRTDNRTRQFWTWAHVPGKRYLNKPIYLLTSRRTFSGAEEFVYDLKNQNRITVIGETTGGGANPGGTRRADDHFEVWVPCGRAINPVTKTNWEGTGVAPDIAVPAARALPTARRIALKRLLQAEIKDENWKAVLRGALADAERNEKRFRPVTFTLKGYPDAREVAVAGAFNFWSDRANPLVRKGGAWVGTAEAEPGRNAYKFIVDGKWILDPANPAVEPDGEFTNSVLVVE